MLELLCKLQHSELKTLAGVHKGKFKKQLSNVFVHEPVRCGNVSIGRRKWLTFCNNIHPPPSTPHPTHYTLNI